MRACIEEHLGTARSSALCVNTMPILAKTASWLLVVEVVPLREGEKGWPSHELAFPGQTPELRENPTVRESSHPGGSAMSALWLIGPSDLLRRTLATPMNSQYRVQVRHHTHHMLEGRRRYKRETSAC